MPFPDTTLALVSSSPALASILAAALDSDGTRRVRTFESLYELGTYMRIAPVDAIVADYELADGNLADFTYGLRHGEVVATTPLAILALTRSVSPDMQLRCLAAGIDEVIVKPMSPGYIEERVAAHLAGLHPQAPRRGAYNGPERRGRLVLEDPRHEPIERRDNVVSLAAHRAARTGISTPPAH